MLSSLGVITLSMPSPSWDPVIGTLGGVLDPHIVISHLNTEWSRRQGLMSSREDPNIVFHTSTNPKCKNCSWIGHIKVKWWAKGGGEEGQYPEWHEGKRDLHTSYIIKAITDTPIIWTY